MNGACYLVGFIVDVGSEAWVLSNVSIRIFCFGLVSFLLLVSVNFITKFWKLSGSGGLLGINI